ncbi:MAG: glycosyltransferase WbuB [Algoriphagus sp.]|nr:glycosyltransferase WbuB [Algoriphagus sp.]
MNQVDKPLKLLIFYQYFGTPKGGWSTRYYEFAKRWVGLGHQVTIVTSPYYKSDIKADGFISKQNIEGIDLIVINSPDSNKVGVIQRMINAMRFSLVSTYYALKLNYDIVLASSGPITIAYPALMANIFRKKKFAFEVRDLWPKGAIELKTIQNKLLIKVGLSFEKWIYKGANLVVSCSPGMDEGVKEVNQNVPTLIIPNSSDNELFSPNEPEIPVGFPAEWNQKSIFIYAGSLGLMDDCSQIIHGAKYLKSQDIKIVIIGDGAEKQLLKSLVTELQLEDRILFKNLMPKQELVKWFSIAKGSFVTFKDLPVLHTNSPNKMFDSFAAGVPIIQSTKGWIKDLIEETHCGFNVDPGNPRSFADAMEAIHADESLRSEMSLMARKVAVERFDRGKLANIYLNRLLELK